MKTNSQRGRASKNKGKRGERELANLLKDEGYDCKRGQQFCGANGDADVIGLNGIHIECKRVERLNLKKAMNQAINDSKDGNMPTVFHRADREDWKVTMLFSDWIKLYRKWESGEYLKKVNRCKGCKHNTDDITRIFNVCRYCKFAYIEDSKEFKTLPNKYEIFEEAQGNE